jgi:hypothetical protein
MKHDAHADSDANECHLRHAKHPQNQVLLASVHKAVKALYKVMAVCN